jgi:hypothetical protein
VAALLDAVERELQVVLQANDVKACGTVDKLAILVAARRSNELLA